MEPDVETLTYEAKKLSEEIFKFLKEREDTPKIAIMATQIVYLSMCDHFFGKEVLVNILEEIIASIKGPDFYKAKPEKKSLQDNPVIKDSRTCFINEEKK